MDVVAATCEGYLNPKAKKADMTNIGFNRMPKTDKTEQKKTEKL